MKLISFKNMSMCILLLSVTSCHMSSNTQKKIYHLENNETESGYVSKDDNSRIGLWEKRDSNNNILKTTEYRYHDSLTKIKFFKGDINYKTLVYNKDSIQSMVVNLSVGTTIKKEELHNISEKNGQILYFENCAQCHRQIRNGIETSDLSIEPLNEMLSQYEILKQKYISNNIFKCYDVDILNSPHLKILFMSKEEIESLKQFINNSNNLKWID